MTIKAHIAKHGAKIVAPSESLVRYWWWRVNKELWEGALPHPLSIDIQPDAKAWAWTYCNEPGSYHLRIDQGQMTKKRLLQILAHESVHAYLWAVKGDRKTMHGKPFMAHRGRVKRLLGIKLTGSIEI